MIFLAEKLSNVFKKYFALEIVCAIDKKKYDYISIGDIKTHLDKRTLISFLKETLKECDFSLVTDEKGLLITKELDALLSAYSGKERKKWGIENSGLCLLVDLTLELIANP